MTGNTLCAPSFAITRLANSHFVCFRSVYVLSAESRCNALAIEMHTQFQLNDFTWNPPDLPPIAPSITPPPPPPSPPVPKPPEAEARLLRLVPIYRATLSTYFVPTADATTSTARRRQLQDGGDPSEWSVTIPSDLLGELTTELDDRAGNPIDQLAACTQSMAAAGAPLPCRTGVNPIRCLDGARTCGDGAANGFEPFLELDFEDYRPDFNGRMYLFTINFRLPSNEEFGRLLFHPPEIYGGDVVENRGWRLTVYDETHNELSVQCQAWNIGSNAVEYFEGLTHVTHACLPATASDSDYDVLSHARFLRITLIGEYRQVWLDKTDVYFRKINDLATTIPPSPPPPSNIPSPPALPDLPSPPPILACSMFENVVFDEWQTYIVESEPCGYTRVECCSKANERLAAGLSVNAFVISATGCCSLLHVDADVLATVPSVKYQFGVSGTGIGIGLV